MNNFSINPNFNTNSFDNSINEFNRAFAKTLNETNQQIDKTMSFSEVFDSVGDKINSKNKALKAGAEFVVGQKEKELSPTAKFAQDVGKGFSNSINELNAIERKSERDIETFASGGDISIHEVMISAQKSNLAMQMAIQLRNQMLNVYNEFKSLSI